MFVSEKHRFVFLEVPRTASTSITKALTEFDPHAPTAIKRRERGSHIDYHANSIKPELAENYRIFAAHRNPYSRLWSHWKHRHAVGNPDILREISWPRYVDWTCEPDSVPEIEYAIVDVPIAEMFDCELVDFWISYEALSEDWTRLADFLSVDLPALEVVNPSRSSHETSTAYNAELGERVGQRFAADFKRFGYEIDSWKSI